MGMVRPMFVFGDKDDDLDRAPLIGQALMWGWSPEQEQPSSASLAQKNSIRPSVSDDARASTDWGHKHAQLDPSLALFCVCSFEVYKIKKGFDPDGLVIDHLSTRVGRDRSPTQYVRWES
jgi:hypothetical protein